MKFYSIFLACIYLLSFPILAETILLKGNETIRGKIKNQSIHSIKVEVNGEVVEISKDKILKIIYLELTKSDEEKIRSEDDKANEELPPLKQKEEDKRNKNESNTRLSEEKNSISNSISLLGLYSDCERKSMSRQMVVSRKYLKMDQLYAVCYSIHF